MMVELLGTFTIGNGSQVREDGEAQRCMKLLSFTQQAECEALHSLKGRNRFSIFILHFNKVLKVKVKF